MAKKKDKKAEEEKVEEVVEKEEEEKVEKKDTKKSTKKTAKKSTAKKKDKKEENIEEVETEKEKSKTVERKKAKRIDPNELITVRSVTQGGLTYISKKTGTVIEWTEYGVEEYMEFGELLTMRASAPKFLNDPFIVVDDEDAAERLGLTKMYADMVDIDNLEGFYKQSPDKIEKQLEKMPRGIKRLIGDKARDLIDDGELYDLRTIKIIEEKLQLDLQILMD